MKTIPLKDADLDACVTDAQSQRILLTRNGAPAAILVGVEGLDREQVELGTSAEFWKLIRGRRREKTLSRAELERAIQRKPAKRKRS